MKNDSRIIFLSCLERFILISKVLERSLWWSAGSGWAILVLLFDLFRARGWYLVKRWLERMALPWKLSTTRAPHIAATLPSTVPKSHRKPSRWRDEMDSMAFFPTSVRWHFSDGATASYPSRRIHPSRGNFAHLWSRFHIITWKAPKKWWKMMV